MAVKLRAGAFLYLLALAGLAAQDSSPKREVNKAIEGLRSITKDLNQALKVLEAHLDEAIARYDSGDSASRLQIRGADSGMTGDVRRADLRKLMLARMLAVRGPGYEPSALADVDRLQSLILDARKRFDSSDEAIKASLTVSAGNFDPREAAEWRLIRDQFKKARAAAADAARRAASALPIDLSDGDSPEEANAKAWQLIVGGVDISKARPDARNPPQETPGKAAPLLPIRWQRNKRVILAREGSYLVAITDPGIEDGRGRRVFYQEEWIQTGVTILEVLRWRVVVDTTTGQHTLDKTYPPRKRPGDLEEATPLWDRDYLWLLRPPEGSTEPSRSDLEAALSEVTRDRERLSSAVNEYKDRVRDALLRNEQELEARNQTVPDAALPQSLRETLFAIRGHLGGAPAVLEGEKIVTTAAAQVDVSLRKLEALAAWGNLASLDKAQRTKLPASEWEILEQRADDEVNMAVSTKAAARAALPPDLSQPQAKFPELQKGIIVRMRREPPAWGAITASRCLQEVWRFGVAGPHERQVTRLVTLITIDSKTGIQMVLGSGTQTYNAALNEALEEVFDENAAQNVPIAQNP
jgi:hypothetical protein